MSEPKFEKLIKARLSDWIEDEGMIDLSNGLPRNKVKYKLALILRPKLGKWLEYHQIHKFQGPKSKEAKTKWVHHTLPRILLYYVDLWWDQLIHWYNHLGLPPSLLWFKSLLTILQYNQQEVLKMLRYIISIEFYM